MIGRRRQKFSRGNPDGAIGFEDALTAFEPFEIKFVVEFRSARFVPIAFVRLDHASGVAGYAAVGEKIRWVGKDGIEASGVAIFLVDGVEEFKGVAVVKAEKGRVGGVNEFGRRRFNFFDGGNVAVQMNGTIFA